MKQHVLEALAAKSLGDLSHFYSPKGARGMLAMGVCLWSGGDLCPGCPLHMLASG